MWGMRYLAAYATGTIAGVLNEHIQKPTQPCYTNPNYSHILTCGLANVYGWSVLALTTYFDLATHYKIPTAATLLCISPILTILEAIMGKISHWYFGEQRWCYPPSYYPACDGYISLVSALYFGIGGALYWALLYRPFISKL